MSRKVKLATTAIIALAATITPVSASAADAKIIPRAEVVVYDKSHVCGMDEMDYVSGGPGPKSITLTRSATAESSWSAEVSVSKSVVDAGVGYNTKRAWTITQSATYNVPKRKYGSITSFPYYEVSYFNVRLWPSGHHLGKGYAMKPIGACFVRRSW
ncbi:hypothetical protein [Planobispora longispora]|uniref:Secreted protein n=1 Tax=Planobispora longispora TaxID=28887 RepID=A0A8J3RJZ9_9ACTN|nr:hypothetical protein [Planobispora longispora]BFE85603.1 hypothetical protein GCM10020093_082040 [Planobispora longispora]GIH76305.1 hypothetical protein Plo01_27340 [Planobispora longispora]